MATKRMLATIGVLFILFAVSTNASPTVDLTEVAQSMSTPVHCPWDCNLNCFGYKRKEDDGCLICECDDTVDQFGDIKINNETEKQLKILFNISQSTNVSSNDDVQSAATSTLFRRWNNLPDGNGNWFIPYVIDSSITDPDMLNSITEAISDLEENVCFKFRSRVASDPSYISFEDLGSGCWSYVGRRISGVNQIQLDQPGCDSKGTVIHEILHALGFFHEQSRPDRDDYVLIHSENIIPGKESNFLPRHTSDIDSLGSVYDYSSIMHYSPTEFSINTKMTITKLDGTAYDYQRDGLARSDIFQLRAMYCESVPTTPDSATTTTEPTPGTTESTTMTPDSATTTTEPTPGTTESTTMTTESTTGTTESTTMTTDSATTTTESTNGTTEPTTMTTDSATTTTESTTMATESTPGTTEPTTGTTDTTTAQICEDKISRRRCRRRKRRGHCFTRSLWMKQNCEKTCGFCGEPATTAEPTTAESTTTSDSPTTTAQPCEDKFSSRRCRRKKNRGHCFTRSDFMKKNCDKTCGFCECNDLDNCNERVANGECYQESTLEDMQQDCPIACGFCGKGCKDYRSRRCLRKKSRGHCESRFEFMARNCPAACGYCVTGNI